MMVSDNIRCAREKKGMSQAKLALALGVKENTVWRWENNKSTPSASMIIKIADILDSTPSELLDTKNNDQATDINAQSAKPIPAAKYAYWGNVIDETQNAIARWNPIEISLIETLLNSACKMIAEGRKKTTQTSSTNKGNESVGQHFDIQHDNNNTMGTQHITVGTVPTGVIS